MRLAAVQHRAAPANMALMPLCAFSSGGAAKSYDGFWFPRRSIMATSERPVADVEVNGEVVSLPVVPVVRSEAAAPAASNDGSQKRPSPGKVACPQNVMDAIYGKKTSADKKKAYEASLQRQAPRQPARRMTSASQACSCALRACETVNICSDLQMVGGVLRPQK